MTDLTYVCADGKTPAAESDFDLEGDSQGQAAAEFLAGAAQTAGAEETADDSSSTSSSSSSSHNNESGSSSSRSTSPASAPTTAGEDQPQQQPQQPPPQLRQQPLQPQPQPQPQPAAASQQPTANVENPSTALSLPTFRLLPEQVLGQRLLCSGAVSKRSGGPAGSSWCKTASVVEVPGLSV